MALFSKDKKKLTAKERAAADEQARLAAVERYKKLRKMSLRERIMTEIHDTKLTRWIRFALVALIWTLFCVWLGNMWMLFVLPLLFDIYITGLIPFSAWRLISNKTLRTVMSWVDSIVYALIIVYFIFAYLGQNYQIPSSSLEKTLLVGDYLWVDKTVYGPRTPQTPLHFPLAQNTIPWLNCKSYCDFWQVDYHRLPGRRNVERFDIVVFNAPHCDTVVTKAQGQVDYYTLVYALEHPEDPTKGVADGRKYIAEHPEEFGEVVWRPVDRRDAYVKRAIGLPGETLKIVDDIVYINDKPLPEPKYVQHNYIVQVSAEFSDADWDELGISRADRQGPHNNSSLLENSYYELPLTSEMLAKIKTMPQVVGAPIRRSEISEFIGVYPLDGNYGWSLPNMGEIWIPRQGSTLKVTRDNLPIYRRVIETYEGNKVDVKADGIYINGKKTDYYTFKLDYYWMMGDNRDNSADSRFWGFVPEDHIIGSPATVLISFDKDAGSFFKSVRGDRILRKPNPDK